MSGEAPSMEVRYAIEIDVFHRTEHGGVGGSWRDCAGWPCRAVREAAAAPPELDPKRPTLAHKPGDVGAAPPEPPRPDDNVLAKEYEAGWKAGYADAERRVAAPPEPPLDVERRAIERMLRAADTDTRHWIENILAEERARLSPSSGESETCYDTEHPDGAYCANTTGLHTCYSKAEHDADNLPQASSGELEERGAHPQSRRITQSKGRQARASSGESDE